jgi:prophage tail gpP-like protein
MSNQITVLIDNEKFEGFTDISLERTMETVASSFTLSTTIKEEDDRTILNPLKVQSEVKILIDDELWLTGKIENVSVSYDESSHGIQAVGRDKTADLLDSSIIQKQYTERNFIKLLTRVLNDNGYSDIKVINNLSRNIELPSGEVIVTESSDTIFSFIDRYAQRLQIFINSDEEGNLVISTEGSEGAGGALVSVKGGKENNIKSANITVNSLDRFRFIEVYSQSDNTTFSKNSISQKGSFEDKQIAGNRRKIMISGKATQKKVLDQIAEWNVVVRRAKGLRYNCEVVGFYTGRDNGLLWQPNTIVQIKDDKCDMDGAYLIQGVTFNKNLSTGSTTKLSIVEIGSFTIDPEQKFIIPSQQQKNKGNGAFFKSAA